MIINHSSVQVILISPSKKYDKTALKLRYIYIKVYCIIQYSIVSIASSTWTGWGIAWLSEDLKPWGLYCTL